MYLNRMLVAQGSLPEVWYTPMPSRSHPHPSHTLRMACFLHVFINFVFCFVSLRHGFFVALAVLGLGL